MAKKAQDIRPKITMACTGAKERNYITKKNRRNSPDRLELMKFCKRENKHTLPRDPQSRRTAAGGRRLRGRRLPSGLA